MTKRTRMLTIGMLLLALTVTVAGPVSAADQSDTLNAADFAGPDSPTCGIQEAVDALPAGGGTVMVPPGKYVLRCGILLRSHVTLRGSGAKTILTRGRQVHAKLTRPARKGESEIEVESTAGFRAGDEVTVFDDKMHGWYAAHCIIKAVEPRRLKFTALITSAHPEGIFELERNAIVVNFFPFICARRSESKEPISDISILDILIDGNLDDNPGDWYDFTYGAIALDTVEDVFIRGCTVRGSLSDGIVLCGGGGNRVESCLVESCRGHGLHPGSGLHDAIFTGNIARRNGRDGLYFCCRVKRLILTNNVFEENGGSGSGGLGWGCGKFDSFNVVSGNVFRRNGQCGIEARGGRDNVITGNVCLDNSQKNPGLYSGIIIADSTHTVVSNNRCGCEDEKPTQKYGIEETGTSNANAITGNVCQGNAQGELVIVGPDTKTSANVPSQP